MVSENGELISLPLLGSLTYREWHGVIDRLYVGSRWGSRHHSYDTEQHYWQAGYLFGTVLRYTIVIAALLYIRKQLSE
jgi:hypothetical protein